MAEYAAILMVAIPVFVGLIAIEYFIGRAKGVYTYRPFDTISSLSSGMTNTLKEVLGLTVIIISYSWLESKIGLLDIKATPWLYLICFIGLDFAGYWSHRFEHVINVFWNRHIIHHSSEEFNLACALRQPFSNFLAIFTFLLIPLALLGVPPKIIAITAPLHLFAQFWYHTRLIGKMGWLENILVTPSHHRVHHAINEVYMDRNFSQIFIIWDKLFGTFQRELEDQPPVYGVKRAVKTWNPIEINYQHLFLLIKDAWRTRSWKDKLRIWFMPTGWRPRDVADKYPVDHISDPFSYSKYTTPETGLHLIWAWKQLTINLLLMLHMMWIIGDYPFYPLSLYGLYIFASIFGYTSLMDLRWHSVIAEIVKLLLFITISETVGSWFGLPLLPISIYSVVSLGACLWLLRIQNQTNQNKSSVAH